MTYKPSGLVLTQDSENPSTLSQPYGMVATVSDETNILASVVLSSLVYSSNISSVYRQNIILDFDKLATGDTDLDFDPLGEDDALIEVDYRIPTLTGSASLEPTALSTIAVSYTLPTSVFASRLLSVAELVNISVSAIIPAPVLTAALDNDHNLFDYTLLYEGSYTHERMGVSHTATGGVFNQTDRHITDLSSRFEIAGLSQPSTTLYFETLDKSQSAFSLQHETCSIVEGRNVGVYERHVGVTHFDKAMHETQGWVGRLDAILYEGLLDFTRFSKTWFESATQQGCIVQHPSEKLYEPLLDHVAWYENQMPPPKTSPYTPPSIVVPELPIYYGTGDLNFCCPLVENDALGFVFITVQDVYGSRTTTNYFKGEKSYDLSFGEDDCCNAIDLRRYYTVENTIQFKRTDTDEEIPLLNITIQTDRDSWCWDFNANVPYSALSLLETESGDPVTVEATINGFVWRFILEDLSQVLKFGANTLSLYGRSVTAFLSDPYAATDSYAHTTEMTSVQLVYAETQKIPEPIYLDWDLVDVLGWNVPAGAWSYSGKTPIEAINEIVTGVGGVVVSDTASATLHIRPKYSLPYWKLSSPPVDFEPDNEVYRLQTYTSSIKYANQPEYNGMFVQATEVGIVGSGYIAGTNGANLKPTVVSPFVNDPSSARALIEAELGASGRQQQVTLTTVLDTEIGLISPTNIVRVMEDDNSYWDGYATGCSITAAVSSGKVTVMQNATIERHFV